MDILIAVFGLIGIVASFKAGYDRGRKVVK